MPSSWIFPIAKNTADTWALVKADNVWGIMGNVMDLKIDYPPSRTNQEHERLA